MEVYGPGSGAHNHCHRKVPLAVSIDSLILIRPSLSYKCMDYHVSIWKIKVTAEETGAIAR